MKNNITNQQIIDEAYEYLKDGQSLRSVAQTFKISHPSVYEHFRKKLIYIDTELFEKVAEKMEENRPKSIKDPEIIKRVLLVKDLFLTGNYTMYEIVDILKTRGMKDVDFFTVYRDLRVRLVNALDLYPDCVNQAEINTINNIINEHVSSNLTQNDNEKRSKK